MATISDVMQSKVVFLQPETTLVDAVAVLCQHRISGAPVVAQDGTLVGLITEYALLDILFDSSIKDAPVAQYMSKDVYSLCEQDSLTRAVHMFVLYGARRLPVLRDGKVVGIVTRRDLLEFCMALKEPLAAPLEELMPELPRLSKKVILDEQQVELIDFA